MTNFCDEDIGFDYVFARLSAIYGATFARHWDGVEPEMIRQEWKKQLGSFLTYRPIMDYAIDCCSPDYPPSALKFKALCMNGPAIPRKDAIEHQPKLTPMPDAIRKQISELKLKWKY